MSSRTGCNSRTLTSRLCGNLQRSSRAPNHKVSVAANITSLNVIAAPARTAGSVQYYNYILVSESTQRTYSGITADLDRRLQQHQGLLPGGAKSTRTAHDWVYLAVVHSPEWVGGGGRACAAAFEMRLRYPTGKRPRPSRFSGPMGRLASLELLLATECTQPPLQQKQQAEGTMRGQSGADSSVSGAEAFGPGQGGTAAAASPTGMLWLWVHPDYRQFLSPGLRQRTVAAVAINAALEDETPLMSAC
ncbi:hypothetical protein Vafri_21901 [Volvox africanus]|uniref:GIY-YIG domain-containing protein n=1 Tax=Volvox africanus TaxID=51714 RepID=A0A8J4BWK5_9CHLO|nr:hypothetical protein Vafri_21901 [Volvox africanus]